MYLTDKNFLKNNTSLVHCHTKTLRNKPDEKNMFSLPSPECASTQESACAWAWAASTLLYR